MICVQCAHIKPSHSKQMQPLVIFSAGTGRGRAGRPSKKWLQTLAVRYGPGVQLMYDTRWHRSWKTEK